MTSQKSTGKKFPLWFYSLFVLIPVLFFAATEGVLRLTDYGKDYPVFVKLYENYPEYLFFNPEIPGKYFTAISRPPGVIADGFREDKPVNGFRVFLLGESSAAGWPYVPNASIARRVKQRLQILYPDKEIEVVNLGVSAINTFLIRDILPAVLEQKPDCILIYTGHNEYYGALGIGSTQSFLPGRKLTNLYISLKKFRTFQLLENIIRSIRGSLVKQEEQAKSGNETLMSRMIGNSTIPLNSAEYQNGLTQFEGNLSDILNMCKDKGIPVLLSRVASNISGMPPFVTDAKETQAASQLFKKAEELLTAGKKDSALILFTLAKDTDPLRFRAPSAINTIISRLGAQYNFPVIAADSILNANDPTGITGKALMVDHLHPNVTGYSLIAKSFTAELIRQRITPAPVVSSAHLDSVLSGNIIFTPLDSIIADIRIRILTGAYPFVPKGEPNKKLAEFIPRTQADTLAGKIVNGDLMWEEGHNAEFLRLTAEKKYTEARSEVDALIFDRPMNIINYRNAAITFSGAQQFLMALPYFREVDKRAPDATSAKAIGSILLNNKQYAEAKVYLQKSLNYNNNDAAVWYNLAGAMANTGDTKGAIAAIKESLRLKPGNPLAQQFLSQLQALKQ